MAVIKCPGCSHQFDTNSGLATHKRSCHTKINAAASKLLQERKVNLSNKAETKRQQIEEKENESQEDHLMDGSDNGEQMAEETMILVSRLRSAMELI